MSTTTPRRMRGAAAHPSNSSPRRIRSREAERIAALESIARSRKWLERLHAIEARAEADIIARVRARDENR